MDKYERDQQIIRMREQGKLIREICEDMGVCKNTVLKAIHGTGTLAPLPWYENRLGLSENALIEYVIHSYNGGKTMKALSTETGVRYNDISKLLREKGISPAGKLIANGIHSTQERTRRILAYRMEGLSYSRIAEKLEISISVVCKTCSEGDTNSLLREKRKADYDGKILELYRQGIPIKRIMKAIHSSYTSVKKVLSEYGIESSTTEKIRDRNKIILQMRRENIPVNEIARKLSMNRFTVYHILEKAAL